MSIEKMTYQKYTDRLLPEIRKTLAEAGLEKMVSQMQPVISAFVASAFMFGIDPDVALVKLRDFLIKGIIRNSKGKPVGFFFGIENVSEIDIQIETGIAK